jgi:DNA polymerase bacteriophage-type
MSKTVWLDFESRSLVNLKNVGLDVYSHHPSTEVLMLAYAFDDGEVLLWQPRLGPMPQELSDAIHDPAVIKAAWNFNFERDILEHKLGIPTSLDEWRDPAVLCAYMSLPIGLGRAGDALSINGKKIHMPPDSGVKLFSVPKKATKKMLANGAPAQYFKDWDSNPEQWEDFCAYCRADVVAEREVYHAAVALDSPMTEEEHFAWLLDQRMNETGVYVDQGFVAQAKKLAEEESDKLLAQMKEITGVENPNSTQQLGDWLRARKYPYDSLDTEHVEEALKKTLPPEVMQVLKLKQDLGGSAYKKLQSIQDRIGPDGRLRDQFVYHGAHTGRWSGRGVQLQNLFKPDKAAGKRTDEFVKAILAGTFVPDTIPTMTVVASVIRAAFVASPGKKLVVGDLSQIESRALAALASCQTMIDAYAAGHDLYKEFMAWLLEKDVSLIDSDERARGKIVILGCGYAMGWKKFIEYAATFGVTLDEAQAKAAVYGFRKKYKEIPILWEELNNAARIAVKLRKSVYVKGLIIDGHDKRVLKIKLPSGRYIHYHNPSITQEENWRGEMEDQVNYEHFDAKGTQPKRLYGGLITENVVQAISRDILLNGMFEAEKAGFTIVMTIHDEIVSEVPLDSPLGEKELLACMSACPWWAEGMGFILAAEGWEGHYYRK